jgi:uncharacterized protein (TIGR03437 family)
MRNNGSYSFSFFFSGLDLYMLRPVERLGCALLLASAQLAFAQQYSITTVAGGAPPATPSGALSISIGQPRHVAVDAAGNFYFSSGNSVFKVSNGTMALVAGNSRPGFSGDGGPAVNAQLSAPTGVAVDKSGNVFISDSLNNRVRIVTPNGIINTYAGNGGIGSPANFGDGGPAVQAYIHLPGGLAVDSSGTLYIADTGDNTIRKVTTDGIINVVAGNGLPSYLGDAGPAVTAELHSPEDVAVDSSGNVYIADTANAYIRKVTTDGNINFVAGDGAIGYAGDNGTATLAGLVEPYGVAVDSAGNIYICERADGRIRQVNTKGIINTIIGNGSNGFSGDGSAALGAMTNLPGGIALDSSGNLYIADSMNNRIRKVTNSGSGTISTIAGNGVYSYSGDGSSATSAQLYAPQSIAVDAKGNFYIADTGNNVVREVSGGIIFTFAGNGGGGDNGPAVSAAIAAPQGVVVDSSGNVYISDTGKSRVRKVGTNGTISTIAGTGTPGYSGDGNAATSAALNTPVGLAVDTPGNLYIADFGNNVVRKVSTGGTISTIAGSGLQGYSGDGGQGTSAQLSGPQGVAVDGGGNLYIADTLNNVIREVTPNGVIRTIAGNGLAGYSGDGGPALKAELGSPTGLSVDSSGNLYVTDSSSRVRKIFPGGIIITIAGTGAQGYSGDGGAATSAMMNVPTAAALDAKGNLYVADTYNNAVRLLQTSGFGTTVAGVMNGGSYQLAGVAPGEIVSIFGSNLGPASPTVFTLTNAGTVGTSLAGTTVLFGGSPAPILFGSPTQINAIVPYSISGSSVPVFVVNQGQTSAPVTVAVTSVAPSLFTLNGSGNGQAAAINQDNSINGSANPAKAGSVVSLFATGTGQTNPGGVDGSVTGSVLPLAVVTPTVTIGGKSATVQYAGGAPQNVAGVTQINVVVPSGLTAGSVPVVVQQGTVSSQTGVTITVSGN